MAEKTLYDILEVSPNASPEAIRAAYERLSDKFDPDSDVNLANPNAKIQYVAVKEAFLTLGDPNKRAAYDAGRQARTRPAPRQLEETSGFWTAPKAIIVGLAIVAISGYAYQQNQKEQARVAAEKAVAAAKAKEAEERAAAARARAEEARLAREQMQLERQQKYEEDRARRQRESDLRRYDAERRAMERSTQTMTDRERRQQEYAAQRAERQRQLEEQQAVRAAQQQAARERAELCRLERERYGKAISCP